LKVKSCVPPYRPRLKWETPKTMWPKSGILKSDGGNIDSQNDQLIFYSHARTFIHVNSVNNCFRLERIIFSGPLNPRDILQNFGLLLTGHHYLPVQRWKLDLEAVWGWVTVVIAENAKRWSAGKRTSACECLDSNWHMAEILASNSMV
jgi:hypothetical protein